MANNTSDPTMKLIAPASDVTANVRIPGRTRRSLAFAAFPFGADQQANSKCHYEVEDRGFGDDDTLSASWHAQNAQSGAADNHNDDLVRESRCD